VIFGVNGAAGSLLDDTNDCIHCSAFIDHDAATCVEPCYCSNCARIKAMFTEAIWWGFLQPKASQALGLNDEGREPDTDSCLDKSCVFSRTVAYETTQPKSVTIPSSVTTTVYWSGCFYSGTLKMKWAVTNIYDSTKWDVYYEGIGTHVGCIS